LFYFLCFQLIQNWYLHCWTDLEMASGTPYFSGYPADYTFTQPQEPPKPESPKPPKRPLTPYMRFSKSVSCRLFLLSVNRPVSHTWFGQIIINLYLLINDGSRQGERIKQNGKKLYILAKAMSHGNRVTLEQKLLNIKVLILVSDIANMSDR